MSSIPTLHLSPFEGKIFHYMLLVLGVGLTLISCAGLYKRLTSTEEIIISSHAITHTRNKNTLKEIGVPKIV